MKLDVKKVISSGDWDRRLVALSGHPLQSALWGDARRYCDGIDDDRWCIKQNDQVIAMLRVEHRGIGPLKKFIAWAPQGPIVDSRFLWSSIQPYILQQLSINKYSLLVALPWVRVMRPDSSVSRNTIWIDLNVGKEQLWNNLDKQWRYGVRRSQKMGVTLETSQEKSKVDEFFKLCQQISDNKQFKLKGSSEFLYFLLKNNETSEVDAKLFLARFNHELAAGVFILRVGKTIHYMWGGVDRKYRKERVGEFIQWQVIEWACSQGYHRYDLEGIDEKENPGVASFKKKMGGEVISLSDQMIWPLNWQGKLLAKLIRD